MYNFIQINNNKTLVKVVRDPISIAQGMMFKKFSDQPYDGMLFMMETPDSHSFYMKNCIIPLDIIFIDDNKISKIHHNCPPCTKTDNCPHYIGYGNYVLELSGGTAKSFNFKVGDQITIS